MEPAPADGRWDVFICHASEDKASVARPLAKQLQLAGLAVWLDEFELRIGDSLLGRIDSGLASSRFGVVIFSPAFITKKWGPQELRGMFALEKPGETRILPVWHDVDANTILEYSPMLADRHAATTSGGMDPVADAIVEQVLRDPDSSAVVSARLVRRTASAVENNDVSALAVLIQHNPQLIRRMSYAQRKSLRVIPDPFPQITTTHLLAGELKRTTGLYDWTLLVLIDSTDSIVDATGRQSPRLERAVGEISDVRHDIARKPRSADNGLSGLNSRFNTVILAGRRRLLDGDRIRALQALTDELMGIQIRTYDSLLETAVEVYGTTEGQGATDDR